MQPLDDTVLQNYVLRFTEDPSVDEIKKIIEDTFTYYQTHPFGYRSTGTCVYADSKENAYCAIGRLLPPHVALTLETRYAGDGIDEICERLLAEPSSSFWNRLQQAHDGASRNLNPIAMLAVHLLSMAQLCGIEFSSNHPIYLASRQYHEPQ